MGTASGVPYVAFERHCYFLNKLAPNNMVIMKRARKMKNNTFAIEAAPAAMPPNPKMAAIMAITKNIIDQRNIDV